MTGFFRMRRAEFIALAVILAASAIAFLPVFGEITILGVAAFGWIMAGILLGAPVALLVLLSREPR